jgi:hypothetical protein
MLSKILKDTDYPLGMQHRVIQTSTNTHMCQTLLTQIQSTFVYVKWERPKQTSKDILNTNHTKLITLCTKSTKSNLQTSLSKTKEKKILLQPTLHWRKHLHCHMWRLTAAATGVPILSQCRLATPRLARSSHVLADPTPLPQCVMAG